MAGRRRLEGRSQLEFGFLERTRRLDRLFKRVIVLGTFLVLLLAIVGTGTGRSTSYRLVFELRRWVNRVLQFPEDRSLYEAQRDRDRARGIVQAREALGQVVVEAGPNVANFLRAVHMDRDSAVLRWGNVAWTLALSSDVFEPDDNGRSYKLKPNVRSIWLINLTLNKVAGLYEILDTPENRRLAELAGGKVVPESVQTTNSWGCRGAEPNPRATVRGIVLGDSNMQGLLVGDDDAPPAKLEARLRENLGVDVSVLNGGVLGYSPEQYYHTLIAFYDRFKPQFVVVSFCANDFGDMDKPENWAEAEYWVDERAQFCRTRGVDLLAVPLPMEDCMTGRRNEIFYPSMISKIFDGSGHYYLYPIEAFIDEHLRLKGAAMLRNEPFMYSPLFNRKYSGDSHMSPIGSDLWARVVTQRLRLIWETQSSKPRPDWLKPLGTGSGSTRP